RGALHQRPTRRGARPAPPAPEGCMTAVAAQLDALRLAVGEVDAIAAVTLKWFDDEDWSGADQLLVERAGFMLGVIAKSAALAPSKCAGFHVAVADTQPVPVGVPWDDNRVTPSAPGNEPAMSAQDAEIVRRIRERCAAVFGQPVGYPFFEASYRPGEAPDA